MFDIWYISGILFILFGIGLSIGLHEIGHLLPAKKFGVKVPNYAIGFGPTLFKIKRGETTYSIKLIPLGGYITMIGMYPQAPDSKKVESATAKRKFFADVIYQARNAHSEHVTPADKNRMFYQLPVWKRLVIMFGGPFMNLLFGLVLMTIAISGIGSMKPSTAVQNVMPCIISDTETRTECTDSDPASPAYAAGIKSGDRILSVDGTKFLTSMNLSRLLTAGKPAVFEIESASSKEIKSVVVTPASKTRVKLDANGQPLSGSDGKPQLEQAPVIGIVLGSERQPQPITNAISESFKNLGQVGEMILTLPKQFIDIVSSTFNGQARDPNGAVSIVGIGHISGEISTNENIDVLDKLAIGISILGSLNFALFLFNMIPLLPLDGGHIAGGIYEAIKRGIFRVLRKPAPGPADTARLVPLAGLVFVVLIVMSLFFILADLINPIKF